jgi:serine/threonine protein kinase
MSCWVGLPDSIGNFIFGSTLGIGSFSLVKKCTDKTTSAVYAVKIIPKSSIMSEQALARFEREVRATIRLQHPGIIKIHAFLTDDLYFYLVMEHCPGDTLLSNMGADMTHSEDFVRTVVKQIIMTVAYIHREGSRIAILSSRTSYSAQAATSRSSTSGSPDSSIRASYSRHRAAHCSTLRRK